MIGQRACRLAGGWFGRWLIVFSLAASSLAASSLATSSVAASSVTASSYVVSGFSRTVESVSQPANNTLPELVTPVNDFAHVIDSSDAAAIAEMIRRLKAATGDVVVLATVPTTEPYGDIREYANKLFENHGRGIGEKGKDNGLLILLALKERKVWIEVGYALEPWVTDGFAGETSRQYMVPEFRNGRYGAGLRAGTARIIARIAEGRQVTLDGMPREAPRSSTIPMPLLGIAIFIAILILSRIGRGPRAGVRRWGVDPWSGWSSGVGPFGGGWSGGSFGGGGFGGGFGGFGGGRSGGGGGGGSW